MKQTQQSSLNITEWFMNKKAWKNYVNLVGTIVRLENALQESSLVKKAQSAQQILTDPLPSLTYLHSENEDLAPRVKNTVT